MVSTGPTTVVTVLPARVDLEMHAMRRFQQSVSDRFAFGAARQPLAVESKFIDPGLALIRLQSRTPGQSKLSGMVTLCLFRKSENEPKPFLLLQMIAVGIPLRGPKRNFSSAATTPSYCVASTVYACHPKERNTVSSSGMGKIMRV